MDQLPEWARALLIGGALAAIIAVFVARKSAQKKPIQGGALSKLLHYLAAVAIVAPALIVLVGSFVYRLPFIQSAGLCLGSLALGFVLLVFMALFEVGKAGDTPAS